VRSTPWAADGLRRPPLMASQRICRSADLSGLWQVLGSNQRRRMPTVLQTAPFGHSGNLPIVGATPRPAERIPQVFPCWPSMEGA
jgi:hypothetical protein